ncbi:motility associated factor glycosyltransferase family protein [Tepidibacter mesophilus]|uniref:motility associated factor glycosyltransferase family protein n=1 Tax=Tepidibacter mesophilus TaxID=655607 RepID=UPI000C078628|nr:6-hydroxymethylpterin diphosphokinase MptE-like protein [Tepidibacter mesophilus]
MGKMFKRNIGVLKEYYEKDYVDYIVDFNDNYEIEIELTKENTYSMKLINECKTRYINSKYSPKKEAYRFIENIGEYNGESVFVIFGMGPGYHILKLFDLLTENNKIIIIEPSIEVFKKAISINDFTKLIKSKNIYFCIGMDINKVKKAFKDFVSVNDLSNISFLTFSQCDKIYEKFYLETVKELKYSVIYNKVEANTTNYFSYEFNQNLFENIDSITHGNEIQKLKDIFAEKPAIIVSAGPSLDKNIKYLKKAQDKSVIITGGRTLKALLENNIIPDIIVSVDPGEMAYDVIKDSLKHKHSKISLVTTVISNSKVMKNHKGKQIYINCPETIGLINDITDKYMDVISMGGSVANACFSLGDYMGCNPLILVGQDLAFTEGKSHAENSKTEGSNNKSEELHLEVEDIYGAKVFTSFPLYTYLKWFENYIESIPNKTVIDATEGGAKIKGTNILTLNETIGEYCKEYINAKCVLDSKLESKNIDRLKIDKVIFNLNKVKHDILNLKKYAKQAIKLSDEMYRLYEKDKSKKLGDILIKLEKIDNNMLKSKNSNIAINYLVEPVILNINLDKTLKEKINETEREQGMRLAMKSKLLYKGIYENVDVTCELIDKSIKKLKESIDNG